MTPTRDRLSVEPVIDTGTGSPVATRPDVWTYEGPPPASDTGTGAPLTRRPDLLGASDAFVPPKWL